MLNNIQHQRAPKRNQNPPNEKEGEEGEGENTQNLSNVLQRTKFNNIYPGNNHSIAI